MKVAVVFGDKNDKVIPILKECRDDLKIDGFTSVDFMVQISSQRSFCYDRIILISTILGADFKASLDNVYNYVTSMSPSTNVIVLCKKGEDDVVSEYFTSTFVDGSHTCVCVGSTNNQVLSDIVCFDIPNLSSAYGYICADTSEVLGDEYAEEEFDISSLTPKERKQYLKQQKKLAKEQAKESKATAEKTKTPLFASLFRGKTKTVESDDTALSDEDQYTDDVPLNEEVEDDDIEQVSSSFDVDYPLTLEGDTAFDSSYTEDIVANSDIVTPLGTSTLDIDSNSDSNAPSQWSTPDSYEEDSSIAFDEDIDFGDLGIDSNKGDILDADEDIEGYQCKTHPERVRKSVVPDMEQQVVDVESVSPIVVGDKESSYREEEDKPKVIEKIVHVEKIIEKRVSGKSVSVLTPIYEGKTHKYILVTGDRGSGVTSTALDLASQFSEHTNVLYFDADTINHGLLNYISYSSFLKYEDHRKQGTLVSRDTKALSRCVIPYTDNLDILTSNFDISIPDEVLEQTQMSVLDSLYDYGVVIADVPLNKLHLFNDTLVAANTVFCVEASVRGLMNFVCSVEDDSVVSSKLQRLIASRGTIAYTKLTDVDINSLVKYTKGIVCTDIDWFGLRNFKRDKKEISESILEMIVS